MTCRDSEGVHWTKVTEQTSFGRKKYWIKQWNRGLFWNQRLWLWSWDFMESNTVWEVIVWLNYASLFNWKSLLTLKESVIHFSSDSLFEGGLLDVMSLERERQTTRETHTYSWEVHQILFNAVHHLLRREEIPTWEISLAVWFSFHFSRVKSSSESKEETDFKRVEWG
jgi:hypothetical protein